MQRRKHMLFLAGLYLCGKQQPPYSSLCKLRDLATLENVLNLKERTCLQILSTPKCKCIRNPAWILCFMPSLCEVHLATAVSKAMSLEIPLQADHIHSAATWDATHCVTHHQLIGLSITGLELRFQLSLNALSHLCHQLSDHLPRHYLTSLVIGR